MVVPQLLKKGLAGAEGEAAHHLFCLQCCQMEGFDVADHDARPRVASEYDGQSHLE